MLRFLMLGALLAPSAAALPAACDPLAQCALDASIEEGAVLTVDAGLGTTRVETHSPAELSPGEPTVEAEHWRRPDGDNGEISALASVACPASGADARCTPTQAFLGGHAEHEGHDVRAWTGTSWRSVGFAYEGDVGGHGVQAGAGTFYFWQLQYLYYDVRVDGEGSGEFGAIPAPGP